MNIEVQQGDVVFRRASNGWIIYQIMEGDGEYMDIHVVEDISDDPTEALWEVLQGMGD